MKCNSLSANFISAKSSLIHKSDQTTWPADLMTLESLIQML